MTGLCVGHTGIHLRVWVPLILRLNVYCQWLWTSDGAAEAPGALLAKAAESSLYAYSSLLDVLVQGGEVGGMSAEARKARHQTHRTSGAPRLRGLAGRMLNAARVWPVPRRLPTSLVRLRVSPVCLSARCDVDSQLSAKNRENGLDTRPPDRALA